MGMPRERMSALAKECSALKARNAKLKNSRDKWKDKAKEYERYISSLATLHEKQYMNNTAVKELFLDAKAKRVLASSTGTSTKPTKLGRLTRLNPALPNIIAGQPAYSDASDSSVNTDDFPSDMSSD